MLFFNVLKTSSLLILNFILPRFPIDLTIELTVKFEFSNFLYQLSFSTTCISALIKVCLGINITKFRLFKPCVKPT